MNDPIMGKALYEVNNGFKKFYLYRWHVEHGMYTYYKSQAGYAIRKL